MIGQAGGALAWRSGRIMLREAGQMYEPSPRVETCPWLSGNALALDAELFECLEGFDTRRFPQYRGDTDFTLRATQRGAPCDVLYSCWVVNDTSRTGMGFRSRVSPRLFVHGLVSVKSNYHLPSTLRFYARHCPRRYLVWSVAVFYLKYCYATLKTWRRVTETGPSPSPAR
jgi:hypothetical protein